MMETSILFAKFMGPVILVTGLTVLFNRRVLLDVFEDVVASPGILFVAGVMALVFGIAVVVFHNHWVAGWPVIITVFGWLAVLGGIVRMAFPAVAISMGEWVMESGPVMAVVGVINTLIGGFLVYQGFLA